MMHLYLQSFQWNGGKLTLGKIDCSSVFIGYGYYYPGWAVGIQLWVPDSFPTLSAHILEEASQKHR